jgi:hypothetical protein
MGYARARAEAAFRRMPPRSRRCGEAGRPLLWKAFVGRFSFHFWPLWKPRLTSFENLADTSVLLGRGSGNLFLRNHVDAVLDVNMGKPFLTNPRGTPGAYSQNGPETVKNTGEILP